MEKYHDRLDKALVARATKIAAEKAAADKAAADKAAAQDSPGQASASAGPPAPNTTTASHSRSPPDTAVPPSNGEAAVKYMRYLEVSVRLAVEVRRALVTILSRYSLFCIDSVNDAASREGGCHLAGSRSGGGMLGKGQSWSWRWQKRHCLFQFRCSRLTSAKSFFLNSAQIQQYDAAFCALFNQIDNTRSKVRRRSAMLKSFLTAQLTRSFPPPYLNPSSPTSKTRFYIFFVWPWVPPSLRRRPRALTFAIC